MPNKHAEAGVIMKNERHFWLGSIIIVILALVLVVLLIDQGSTRSSQTSNISITEKDWSVDETKQVDRQKFIQRLIEQGVFSRIDYREYGATVWVQPPFYDVDFETKTSFCRVVYSIVATRVHDENVGLTLKDVISGKNVGVFDQFGLSMQ